MLKPQTISFKGGSARFTHVVEDDVPSQELVEGSTEAAPLTEPSPDWEDITGRQ